MSDSSSVDRWHPSNVETLDPANAESESWGVESVAKSDYEALYADRGRVLAAIEKRVEGLRLVPPNVGYGDGWQDYNSAIDDALNAIKSSFREVDQ